MKINSQLNPLLNFENFVEGDFNLLACSIGKKISKNPGINFLNPLFIYSDIGLGKTHLANAIGLRIQKLYPKKNIFFISFRSFNQQYKTFINKNRNDFINFYKMIDVLILDDLHLLFKTNYINFFFKLFNYFFINKKQMIFTANKSLVNNINQKKNIISYFKYGISININHPNINDKKQILIQKIKNHKIVIKDQIINYIASHLNMNIRELESFLILIIKESQLYKKLITVDLVQIILNKFINKNKNHITIQYIISLICNYFKIELSNIQSKSRKREIVQARQIAMYFSKKYTKASLQLIGYEIGNRDHSTVLHAFKTVENLLETDKKFKFYFEQIKEKIEFYKKN